MIFSELKIPGSSGIIGMASCPGRWTQLAAESSMKAAALLGPQLAAQAAPSIAPQPGPPDEQTHDYLVRDLAIIEAWGAEILVSLIEPSEYALAGVERLPELVPIGIRHIQLPIADFSVPDAQWEELWLGASPNIRSVLMRGSKVCIHCMGGYGRTGMVAARLLIEFGVEPEEAIARVRSARPGAIEMPQQEAWVLKLRAQ
jgi:predicted protein tyrosine phosphatase